MDDRGLLFVCGYSGWLTNIMMLHHAVSEDTTLRPGATVTVAMPVGPRCHPYADGRQLGPRVGFLVYLIQSDGQLLWGDRPPEQVGGPLRWNSQRSRSFAMHSRGCALNRRSKDVRPFPTNYQSGLGGEIPAARPRRRTAERLNTTIRPGERRDRCPAAPRSAGRPRHVRGADSAVVGRVFQRQELPQRPAVRLRVCLSGGSS